ncbi:molybdopterin-guanine dinucleotide biosynthesis protein B [Hyphomicrobiales bacterium]|jgi:molybdopterin-guanine dinucleotide biosynthesis protein MobB|nr:molybdopterin-guanine dinucleotide biosynthesis protein B [Hyphomicrobiales bacterium]MDC3272482.1 molybdopterin-guanine dinucleotide biosynthesis protein B [Hyphomicrobiales bacterium]|tara:strand:+ start:133 stop:642 length:510 start_codon:yes stop_codon:yes gene_type:complete
MKKKPFSIGIVGLKNTGKTTLITNIIKILVKKKYNISTIKHAHHEVQIDEPGRDSHQHRIAGAHQVILSTNNKWALMNNCEETPNLEYLINKFEKTDIVLVEGYKNSKIPKIEVRRYEKYDYKNEDTIKNIIAIISDIEINEKNIVFSSNDYDRISDFIIKKFNEPDNE